MTRTTEKQAKRIKRLERELQKWHEHRIETDPSYNGSAGYFETKAVLENAPEIEEEGF